MIKTYAPGTLGGDIEEYCPHCDNCIGVSAEEEDSYETTCPVCGKQLMLCTYCHDDFGDNCNWNDNWDERCSRMRTDQCDRIRQACISAGVMSEDIEMAIKTIKRMKAKEKKL